MKFTLFKGIVFIIVIGVSIPVCVAQRIKPPRVTVRIISDEADAVLSILEKVKAGQTPNEEDWQRLFATEGYVRLKKREAAMQRAFEDSDFKTFVLSEDLVKRSVALKQTLARWKSADINRSARLALAYLPAAAHIEAKIYPEIKPRDNSFVFDLDTDPAIFLYLNPEISKEKFENTLAHELHHIGFGTGCPPAKVSAEISKYPENIRNMLRWVGAFGEGFAMLAAAGGPNTHPHAVSKADDRARWDRDVANFDDDLIMLDQFFTDIMKGRLTEEERTNKAVSFYGVQGPWYTVGWKMAVTIEKAFGRSKLIECMCDQRLLFTTYNKAAAKYNRSSRNKLATWSQPLTEAITAGK